MKVYVVRREDGAGGAEGAARRITEFLSKYFDTTRIKAGDHDCLLWNFGGTIGPGWYRSMDFAKRVNSYFSKSKGDRIILSLERGVLCDIYRAGDGVHRRFMDIKYKGRPWKATLSPINWVAPMLERFTLKSCKSVIANSKMVRSDLLEAYPWLDGKIEVIVNGVDTERFNTEGRLEIFGETKVFAFVGHDWKRKGFLACLKILAAYQKEVSSDFVLKVAGKIDRFELSDVISQFGLSDKVEFLGVVKHVEKLYKEADTLILPTQYDPSSNACLEALACGCGVVTTRENGASEFLESGAGWVMDDSGEKGVLDYLKSSKKVDEISCLVSKSSLHKEALGIKALVEKRV